MGLLACPEIPSCGYLEIVMSNDYGDGWANNTLDVYRNGSFYLSIPFYWGSEQTTMIPAENNDEFDFIYLGGTNWDPESEGYVVSAPDGSILVNQSSSGQVPESVTGIIACEENTGISNLSSDQLISVFPNPTKEFIEVDAPSRYYHSDVVLYDMGGVEIYRWKYWKGELLNMENINSGVYFLEFQGKEVIKKRVVKI